MTLTQFQMNSEFTIIDSQSAQYRTTSNHYRRSFE